MNLLFVLDYIYSGETTNIKLAGSLAQELGKTHQVSFLCNATATQRQLLKGENTTFFESYADKTFYEIVAHSRGNNEGKLKLFASLIKRPLAFINIISTIIFKCSLAEKVFKNHIENVCSKANYDAVISVSCPHYTALALANSKINAKKICYMLDPYWSNKTMSYGVSLKREMKLYKNISAAAITDLMLDENKGTALQKYISKMHPLPFPALAPKAYKGNDIAFDSGKINCAFVGNLYPKIRSPKYILELLSKLNKDITINITGSYEGFESGFFEKYKVQLGDAFALNMPVNSDVANDILQKADILINIGNTVANQLPSKVLEYISTGKPVLNFYKIDNCPSLPYFAKYPLALSVKEDDFSDKTIEQINAFCINNKGKKIEYDVIAKLFEECSVQSVSKGLEDIILKA